MLLLVFCSLNFSTQATNYYINNVQGTDANSGLTKHHPWKTIAPLSNVILSAGDSVFFASGQEFSGPLVLNNSTGAAGMPIYIRTTETSKSLCWMRAMHFIPFIC
jgi:hypothetical protein